MCIIKVSVQGALIRKMMNKGESFNEKFKGNKNCGESIEVICW